MTAQRKTEIEEIIQINENLLNSLSSNIKTLTFEAVNWTPWWGGDYTSNTLTLKDDRIKRIQISLPTVETIKGVVKWVIRSAISCHFRGSSYRELNTLLAPVYGGTVRSGNSELHFDSLIRLDVEGSMNNEAEIKQEILKVADKLKSLWNKHRHGFTEALLCLALSKYSCARNFFKMEEDCKNVFDIIKSMGGTHEYPQIMKAYGIPRVELALLGIDSWTKAVEILPIPPDTINVKVTLSINQRLIDILGAEKAAEIAYLTGLAIIYAFEVHGIGRGSSRGFGRFRIFSVRSSSELIHEKDAKKLEEKANEILNPETAEESIRELQEELFEKSKILIEVSQKVSSNLGVNIAIQKTSDQNRVPCLNNETVEIKVITSLRHPFPAPTKRLGGKMPKQLPSQKLDVLDIYEALSAIGYATLKVLWKAYSLSFIKKEGFTSASTVADFSGVGYHTWILGLPRWQRYTGYALVSKNKVKYIDNTCMDNLQGFDSGRRKSSIIMYPLPGGKSAIILILKTSMDHLELIDPSKTANVNKHLVHVGKHKNQKQSHVVSIYYAASGRPIKSKCGNDVPSGIIYPKNIDIASKPEDVIDKVYKAALNFLELLLS